MRVFTCIEYQMTEDGLELIREESFEYEGAVALCKGDKYAKEQADRQFRLQQQELDRQNAQFDKVNNAFSGYLSGNMGFDPQMLADMQSKALDDNATGYNNAGSALRLALQRNGDAGGGLPISGNGVRGLATFLSARANDEANSLRNIRMANAQQAQTNQFNAGSLMSGNAAALSSPLATFTSGANSALGQYLQSKNNGFLSQFTNVLGGTIGKGIGTLATGGIGNLFKMNPDGTRQ